MILNDVSHQPSEPVSFAMPWHGPIVNTTLTLPNLDTRTVVHSFPMRASDFLETRGRTHYVKFPGLTDPTETAEEVAAGMDRKNDAVLFGYTRQYHHASRTGLPILYRDAHGIVWQISVEFSPTSLSVQTKTSETVSLTVSAGRFPYIGQTPPSLSVILSYSATISTPPSIQANYVAWGLPNAFGTTQYGNEYVISPTLPWKPPTVQHSPDGSTLICSAYYRRNDGVAEYFYNPWHILKIYKVVIASAATAGDLPSASVSVYMDEAECCGHVFSGSEADKIIYGVTVDTDPGPPRTNTYSPSETNEGAYATSYTEFAWFTPLTSFDADGNIVVWKATRLYTGNTTYTGFSEASGTETYTGTIPEWEGDGTYDYANGLEQSGSWSFKLGVYRNGSLLREFAVSGLIETESSLGYSYATPGPREETSSSSVSGSCSLGGSYSGSGYDGLWTSFAAYGVADYPPAWPPDRGLFGQFESQGGWLSVNVTNNVARVRILCNEWSGGMLTSRYYDVVMGINATTTPGMVATTVNPPFASWDPRFDTLSVSYTDTLSFV